MKNKRLLQFCLVGIVCLAIATGSTIVYFNCKDKEPVPVQTENAVDPDENMDSAGSATIEEVVEESEEKQKEELKEELKEVSKEETLQKAKANTTKDKNIVRLVEEKKDIESESKETTDTTDGTTVEITADPGSVAPIEITSGPSSDAPVMSNNNEAQNAPEQPVQPSTTTSTTTDATTGDSSQPVKVYNPNDIPDKLPPTEFSQEWHDMWLDIDDPSQWDAVVQDVMDNITEKYPPVENNQ